MSTKPLMLITGATGLIGFRTLVVALRSNYAVRVAIRRPEQEDKIRNAASVQPHLHDLSFILVPDMTAPDAFISAIKDVSYVIHVASPVPMKPDVQEHFQGGKSFRQVMYDPAVKGTLEVLRAAAKKNSVKRVVITASGNILACTLGIAGCKPTDIRPCPTDEEADTQTVPGMAYKNSKIMAVTAARKFMAEEKRSFDMVIACPGYVQGAHELASSVEELRANTSWATIEIATGKEMETPPLYNQIWVGDVAKAHVQALTNPNVKANDVLVLTGNGRHSANWECVGALIRDMFPQEIETGVLSPKMDQKGFALPFNGTSTEEKLGFQFVAASVWIRDSITQYLQLLGREAA